VAKYPPTYESSATTVTMLDSDDTLGVFEVGSNNSRDNSAFGANNALHAFNSGLPIEPGDSLRLVGSGSCTIFYRLSGYCAAP
jgi:hypothetical protein